MYTIRLFLLFFMQTFLQSGRAFVLDDKIFHNPLVVNSFDTNKLPPEEEKNPEFWRSQARDQLIVNLGKQQLNLNKAKNLIIFLGDGMSFSTVTAARILKGQQKGRTGEDESLSFEKFPHVALSKVRIEDVCFFFFKVIQNIRFANKKQSPVFNP